MIDVVCYYAEFGRPYRPLLERMAASAKRHHVNPWEYIITKTLNNYIYMHRSTYSKLDTYHDETDPLLHDHLTQEEYIIPSPAPDDPEKVWQPMIRLEILTPQQYLGQVVNLKNVFDLEVIAPGEFKKVRQFIPCTSNNFASHKTALASIRNRLQILNAASIGQFAIIQNNQSIFVVI